MRSLAPDAKGNIRPAAGSLLADLWPTTRDDFMAALAARTPDGDTPAPQPAGTTVYDQTLRRVDAHWRPPLGERVPWKPTLTPREAAFDIEYNWAGAQARRTGTVLHRLLERVGTLGIESLTAPQRARLIERIPVLLEAMGTRADQLPAAVAIVRNAFEQTLDGDTGQWILSNRHAEAACELAISGVIDGELATAVVERTFVDADGVRWIVDYNNSL